MEQSKTIKLDKDKLLADATRYRWLKKRRPLVLVTDNTIHKLPNGLDTYVSSHRLLFDGKEAAPAPTLDELIDKAMGKEE